MQSDCVDVITQTEMQNFLILRETRKLKNTHKYVVILDTNISIQSQNVASGQRLHDGGCGCAVVYCANLT
jgi:hypothetical protein